MSIPHDNLDIKLYKERYSKLEKSMKKKYNKLPIPFDEFLESAEKSHLAEINGKIVEIPDVKVFDEMGLGNRELIKRFGKYMDNFVHYLKQYKTKKDYDKFKYQWGLKASWEQIEHAKKKYSIQ